VLDPYFTERSSSGCSTTWIARARADRGELAFGTIDSFLVSRLGGGATHSAPHVIEVTNASRTLLMDLAKRAWDPGMCDLLRVPTAVLPKIVASAGEVARTRAVPGLPDGIPIAGMAGDQQAALFGQACFAQGDAAHLRHRRLRAGERRARPIASRFGLLSTVGWQIGDEVVYALEGSSFIAGAAVQWLRDGSA
jgi:glycerol kinase